MRPATQRLALLAAALVLFGLSPASPAAQPGAATRDYPTVRVGEPSLPMHTVYRPYELDKLGFKLPIVLWENGYCNENNGWYRHFLTRIASTGFLVIARGAPDAGTGELDQLDQPMTGLVEGEKNDYVLSEKLMRQALTWALKENQRRGSAYFHRLDTSRIGTFGYSCGGVASMKLAVTDARVRSALIFNSQSDLTKDDSSPGQKVGRVTKPIAWVMGGPSDIAYVFEQERWMNRPANLPALHLENVNAGHFGFWEGEGAQLDTAKIAIAWLDYTLNGNRAAGKYLLSNPCAFCGTVWTSDQKGWSNYKPPAPPR